MTTSVPFKDGLMEKVDGEWVLVGCECRQCGQVIFPCREACLNCLGRNLEKVNLSRQGRLYSYTIVHMPSEHFPPPYAVGWIELPEGVRVFSQIRGWQEHPLKTGMDMALTVEKLWDEEDREVTGYIFRPSAGEGGS